MNVGGSGCSDRNGGCSELCVNGETEASTSHHCLSADQTRGNIIIIYVYNSMVRTDTTRSTVFILGAYSIIESGFGFTLNLVSDSLGKSNDFRSVSV